MLLTRLIDAGGRLIKKKHIRFADEGKPHQAPLEPVLVLLCL